MIIAMGCVMRVSMIVAMLICVILAFMLIVTIIVVVIAMAVPVVVISTRLPILKMHKGIFRHNLNNQRIIRKRLERRHDPRR